jgi:hypothetical protein
MGIFHQTTWASWHLSFILAAVPSPALACGTCSRLNANALELPHPKAIEIAVATRAAIEKGSLSDRTYVPRAALLDGGDGFIALHKVSAPQLVEAWSERLARSKTKSGPLTVHFLFIDTEQSCALIVRHGTVIYDSKPPSFADSHIVTTRIAFYALLDGAISVSKTQRLGLLLVEGDPQATAVVPGRSE